MHTYTVEFRIYGRTLNTSAATDTLGLGPSLVREIGDRRGQTTYCEEAMWGYNGYPQDHGSKQWDSLEEGLVFILERLWPVKGKIDGFKLNHNLVLWCGHFQSDFNGGPSLSPSMLKKLGEFGVKLFIDTYFNDESEEKSGEGP